MIFGHIITTTCLYRSLENLNLRFAYAPFLFGALFPDLIDKTLALLTHIPGRAFGHSIVLLTSLYLVLAGIFSRNKKVIHAFFAGTVLHLLQDIPLGLEYLLWPFMGSLTPGNTFNVPSIMWGYYVEIVHPIAWSIELLCLPWFFIIVFTYLKRYSFTSQMVTVPERVKR